MLKPKKIIITIIVAFAIALCGSIFLRRIYVPPILMYHSVNPNPNPWIKSLIVRPDDFERQLRFLKEKKYNVIDLISLARLIQEKKRIPLKTVVITLDDGYKDSYTYAYPLLKKYNFPATIFLIYNEIGRAPQVNSVDDRLNWQEIKEMQSSKLINFGSHGLGPEPLVNIKDEALLKKEIFDSKRLLEDELGERILAFSYPEGRFNLKIRQLVSDAGYACAVGTKTGSKWPWSDFLALKRIKIPPKISILSFWFKVSGYHSFFKDRKK